MLSIGAIAKELGEDFHRVRYAIETRGIKPISRAGNAHVYGDDAVKQIRAPLANIGTSRTKGAAAEPEVAQAGA